MNYHYRCAKDPETRCTLRNLADSQIEFEFEIAINSHLIEFTEEGDVKLESPLVWVVNHLMDQTPDVKCLVCLGNAQMIIQKQQNAYIRGNGYLDTSGCRRDMNLYKLMTNDPYGHMRQSGERDHLMDKMRKGGKFDPKTKHYVPKTPPKS